MCAWFLDGVGGWGLIPAVSDDWPGVRRVAGFDPAQEVEEGGGVLRHAVVRPVGELQVADNVCRPGLPGEGERAGSGVSRAGRRLTDQTSD